MIKYLQIIVLTLCVSGISNYHVEKYAHLGQFNYVVSIWRNTQYLCSGTIITEKHILTRVLCTNDIASSELSVIAGTVRTDYEFNQILRVKHIHIHYNFVPEHSRTSNQQRWKNDIAVLELHHELIWYAYMGSGRFFIGSYHRDPFDKCKVIGWKPKTRTSSVYHLIWIEARVMTNAECELYGPLQNEKCLVIDTKPSGASTRFVGSPVVCNNFITGMIVGEKDNHVRIFLDLLRYLDFLGNAIDGEKTDVECGEDPYIVSIWNRGRYKCGGVIISDVHILTAAHCILFTEKIDLRVVAGSPQILPSNRRIEWLLVDNVQIQDWSSGIAILTIEPPSTWNLFMRPAEFLSILDVPPMLKCEVFRWHRAYDIDGETLIQLVRTSEKILSDQECRESGVHLGENQFCTTGTYSHHSANIEHIGNPLVCAGMVFGIMVPSDFSSPSSSHLSTFIKIAAYINKLSL